MVERIFVEKKEEFDIASKKICSDLKELLKIDLKFFKRVLRYDVEGLAGKNLETAKISIFSEPTVDNLLSNLEKYQGKQFIVVEYLDGQYDQRADSAAQCVQLLTAGVRPEVKCATVYIFDKLTSSELEKIKKFLINPVDSKEGSNELPKTLKRISAPQNKMRIEESGFIDLSETEIKAFHQSVGFAMSFQDLVFVQDYFKSQKRNPTKTELKVIDTYWSDHCRHTTFLTEIKNVQFLTENPHIKEAFENYEKLFKEMHGGNKKKYPCLMDIATIGAKKLRKEGYLQTLDVSDEINACSVEVKIDNDGEIEDWLIMFKNETHNHPTEIEPFGGAATCLGGAIRDPLSGRAYVYQAMRITGAGNPLEKIEDTLHGKLPQRVLTKTALSGFSSYGNQIGLATGIVREIYNDRFKAKRLETGYVIGGAKKQNVVRQTPEKGDLILLVGGDTGRDGCGGATGSSKAHTQKSVDICGAEVQKGNPPEERKLQRLFKNSEAAKLIIRCNDFGAGGVSVAIGELADSLNIQLDKIEKKYDGLNATELAISESQERMAVVIKKENLQKFVELANEENLKATLVAAVTDSGRLKMFYGDETIVDIERSFLDTNGVRQSQEATVSEAKNSYFNTIDSVTENFCEDKKYEEALSHELKKLNNCSQKGLGEVFDGTIGALSVLMPFGGKNQLTPSTVMAAKPPVSGFTKTVTLSSYGINSDLMIASPFIGAIHSVVCAVTKLVASGAKYDTIYLSLQEYFKRLYTDSDRWGEPLSALLGALSAQLNLKIGAIGGKDSMSGSFENIDVPPTLIAFGMGVTKEDNIIHNAFSDSGYIYRYEIPRDKLGYPDFQKLSVILKEVETLISEKQVLNSAVEENGFLVTLAKSLFGNNAGVELDKISKDFFKPTYGDIILVTKEKTATKLGEYLGSLNDGGKITIKNSDIQINIETLKTAFVETLESVFPTVSKCDGKAENISFKSNKIFKGVSIAAPKVFIPVFPGTNCEFDTAKAFERAGAKTDIFVVKNRTASDIEASIEEMERRIKSSQIIAFPGGFSGGDEPDGSGKFIATAFRNPILASCVEELLYKRDGLIVGICNGFQALIKLGLLPFGKIQPQNENSATLTFNNIARHVSTMCNIRIASDNSPWLTSFNVGDIFSVPVSHGEGKFICDDETLATLIKNGQIATQYVDEKMNATMLSPFNPNGSRYAIEGIVSTDGRVLGKMGHSERYQKGLYQNSVGNFNMDIFSNGVKYFK